jgi:creatinine amidohydrolase
MDVAETATLTMPEHLEAMIPDVVAGDETALLVLLAEGLKAEETGKGTSSHEMSSTGVWGIRNIEESTAEQGRQESEDLVQAAVRFIERWNELRPINVSNGN